MHPLIRSDVFSSLEEERTIRNKGKLTWTQDGRIRVIYLQGSAYERGYQHGALLKNEIQDNVGFIYSQALSKFRLVELFSEAFDRMRPFIPEEYFEEMRGLAHGSEMPLHVIHHFHALPEIGEWSGIKKIKNTVKEMMDGKYINAWASTCSNICANNSATSDGKMYVVRVLDWGLHRISKLHKYPLIQVHKPDNGIPFANIAWAGFIGAISGMNLEKITLGEMGYGSPPGESLHGKPMPFLLRDILSQAHSLKDVRRIISTSTGTNSFVFLMSDGKTKQAELYVRDRNRFLVFKPGQDIIDAKANFPGLKDFVYGGHYQEKMTDSLKNNSGKISPELLMKEIIPHIAMPSNFQNVIYIPEDTSFWVNNAQSKEINAANQPYSFFDLKRAVENF